MSANIDTMIYVGEVPWHGLGVHYSTAPKSSEELVKAGGMDWTVNHTPMYTDLHTSVQNYKAIYREDNNDVLGVINAARPRLVQNIDAFKPIDELLKDKIDVDTAASLGHGESIFGCFKVREQYKVLDDDVDHYYVIFNEHLKADGKVTVLNTPIRVVCQNTLAAALSKNFYKLRVPVVSDTGALMEIASKVFNSAGDAISQLQHKAEKMATTHITREYVDKVLDELFPYIKADGELLANSVANEKMSILRNQFITECMGAEDLQNYRGTSYQMFNALTNWTGHFFSKVDKAYDLNYRMKLLPGVGVDSPANMVDKYLKLEKQLVA